MSYTPGPWKAGPFQVYVGNIIDRDETFAEVADCYLGTMRQPKMSSSERAANIRLIAAAPRILDLFYALEASATLIEKSWEAGDLAEAVTQLMEARDDTRALLRELEGKESE